MSESPEKRSPVVRLIPTNTDHRLKQVIATWENLDLPDQLILYGLVKTFGDSSGVTR